MFIYFFVYHLFEKSANSDNYFDYGMENEKVRMFLSNCFGSLLLIFYTSSLRHSHFFSIAIIKIIIRVCTFFSDDNQNIVEVYIRKHTFPSKTMVA